MDSPVAPQGKYYTECEQYMCMLDGNPLHCVDSNRDLACLVPRHTSPSPLTPDPHPARGGRGACGSKHKYRGLVYLHGECELSVESEQ